MQCTTKRRLVQLVLVRWHILVVLSLLVLVLGGQVPDSAAGWITCPPQVVGVARHLGRTVHRPLLRSALLGALWSWSGSVGLMWVCLVPWGLWLWQSAGVLWPGLRRQPEWRGGHWLLWQGQSPSLALPELEPAELGPGSWALGLGCVVCHREEPWVEVVPEADGSYTATLCGHFTWHVAGDHPFRARVLLHCLRGLEVAGPQRGGRRTRDGRTPFVAQVEVPKQRRSQ